MIVIDSVEILQRQFFSQPMERGFFFGFFFPTILCIDISLVSRQTTILAAVIPNKLQSSKYDTLKAYWIVTRKKQFKREKAKSKKKRQKTNQQRCFIFILFFFYAFANDQQNYLVCCLMFLLAYQMFDTMMMVMMAVIITIIIIITGIGNYNYINIYNIEEKKNKIKC